MTISYTADVANASGFGTFARILVKWRGSVYKLILKELVCYMALWTFLSLIYRCVLCKYPELVNARQFFEGLKAYCAIQMSSIPLTFVLGFYVSLVVKRWWDQYQLLPFPDSLGMFSVGLIRGSDERARLMRRNIMRYFLLSYVIVLRRISLRVRKRFPTMDHMIEAGLLMPDELKLMGGLSEKGSKVSLWWMPLVWATRIVDQARAEGKIASDPAVQTLLGEISKIRIGLTRVQHYDMISVPLVYTQVCTLAVYFYFLAAVMGAQWVSPEYPKDFETVYKGVPAFEEKDTLTPTANSTGPLPDVRSANFTAVVNFFWACRDFARGVNVNSSTSIVNSTTELADLFVGNSTCGEAKMYTSQHSSEHRYYPLDLYFPFFLALQFAFFVGWLKVAETLINPFGEDDDDYELNYLIDRHIQVAYLIVDDMSYNQPELVKDIHWESSAPRIPYTIETLHVRKEEPKGSAEVLDEEDNYISTHLNYQYPSFLTPNPSSGGDKSAVPNGSANGSGVNANGNGGIGAPLDAELGSDYEAIDGTLFGWWKNVVRKSLRQSTKSRASNSSYLIGAGLTSAAATGSRPILSRLPSRKSTKSLRSLRSGYSRMFMPSSRNAGKGSIPVGPRKRSISVSALTSPANSGVGPSLPNDYVVDTESSRGNNNRLNKPNMNKERRFSKSRSLCGKDSLGLEGPYDLDVDEMLHGDLHNTSVASNPDHLVSNLAGPVGEIYGGLGEVPDLRVNQLPGLDEVNETTGIRPGFNHNRVSYLSTITEQYSPYGTEKSRKISAYPPTAEAVFKQGGLLAGIQGPSMSGGDKPDSSLDGASRQAQVVPTTSESDEPYYPMGSEMSLRPTTPRFIVEEVSSINCDNYEPIMVARDASSSTQVYSDKPVMSPVGVERPQKLVSEPPLQPLQSPAADTSKENTVKGGASEENIAHPPPSLMPQPIPGVEASTSPRPSVAIAQAKQAQDSPRLPKRAPQLALKALATPPTEEPPEHARFTPAGEEGTPSKDEKDVRAQVLPTIRIERSSMESPLAPVTDRDSKPSTSSSQPIRPPKTVEEKIPSILSSPNGRRSSAGSNVTFSQELVKAVERAAPQVGKANKMQNSYEVSCVDHPINENSGTSRSNGHAGSSPETVPSPKSSTDSAFDRGFVDQVYV